MRCVPWLFLVVVLIAFMYRSNLLNVGILSTTQDNGVVGEMRMNESIAKG